MPRPRDASGGVVAPPAQKATALNDARANDTTTSLANDTSGGRVTLELEPVDDRRWEGIDPTARLRMLLKAALRSYGWRVRCVGRGGSL